MISRGETTCASACARTHLDVGATEHIRIWYLGARVTTQCGDKHSVPDGQTELAAAANYPSFFRLLQTGRVEREIARRAAPPRGLRSGGEIRETIKPLRANPFDDDVARIALQATGERTRTQR